VFDDWIPSRQGKERKSGTLPWGCFIAGRRIKIPITCKRISESREFINKAMGWGSEIII
jgi:hypothetical protein